MSCLICNKPSVSLRTCVNIFKDLTQLKSGKKLVDILNEILEIPIKEDGVHSKVICNKCYVSCTEYNSIQVRLKVIQTSMLNQFKKTLQSCKLVNQTEFKKESKDVTIGEKKLEGKKIVLPASKLKPLPPDFVLRTDKWQQARFAATTATKLNNQEIKILTPSTLNLKGTFATPVPTQSITTTSSLTEMKQRTTFQNSTSKTVSIVTSPVITATVAPIITSAGTRVSNSLLNINIKDLQKNNLTSALLGNVKSDVEHFVQAGSSVEDGDIGQGEQSMDVDQDCSLAVIGTENDTKMFIETTPKFDVDAEMSQSDGYFDVNLLSSSAGDTEELEKKYILGKLEVLDDDNGDQQTILLNNENGSIIRVVAGEKLLYGDSELSLVVPGEGHDDGENDDNHESNDDTQIELQVSGDEETAKAIIAAAQEQGGAFITVESGEMFHVKSIESKTEIESEAEGNADVMIEKIDGQYKCLICERIGQTEGAMFPDAANATQHVRSVHNAHLHYCALCDELMSKKADYIAHLERHSNKAPTDKNKIHVCKICNKKFNTKQGLSVHMNSHSDERPYACDACGKTFVSKYSRQTHLKTHQERPRPFKCTECSKSFLTQQNLTQHQITHTGVKDFICKVCDKAFSTQHNLDVHSVVHSGNRPFVCGICGKGFARRPEVKDHIRIHTGERPFSCDICDAKFTQRSNLHSHRRATHFDDKRHKCQLCPKRFKRRRLLTYHVKSMHTGERPLRCELCRASFVYPEHYRKHLRIHSGEKPFVCEVCGRPFTTRDNLNTHLYVHSDKKPYECAVCGIGYMRKQILFNHIKNTGHFSDSIIMNQPNISQTHVVTASGALVLEPTGESGNIADPTFNTTEALVIESAETSAADKSNINLVQDDKNTPVITLHNVENIEEPSALEAVGTELPVHVAQIADAEGEGMLRLLQLELPDGRSGWIALD